MSSLKMKRIKRDPERFDVLELFEKLARQHGFNLQDPATPQDFINRLSASFVKSKDNEKLLYGRHVQSMFEHVAAGLGKTIFIKQEDTSGEFCSVDTELQPPDFLIVLEDQSKIFVEVKNCTDVKDFTLSDTYLSKLKKYAALFGNDLFFAIFWVGWRSWTLIRPVDLVANADKRSIDFADAMQKNHMYLLGDSMVGTKPPICVRIIADVNKPRGVGDDGQGVFTIGSVEVLCDGNLVEDTVEQNLASYFLLNSNWDVEDHSKFDGRNLVSIEFIARPKVHEADQDTQSLGFLSTMISNSYINATAAESGGLQKLSPKGEPGSLSILIPEGHHIKKLPLFFLSAKPKLD